MTPTDKPDTAISEAAREAAEKTMRSCPACGGTVECRTWRDQRDRRAAIIQHAIDSATAELQAEVERLENELAAEQAEVKCFEEALAELDEHVMRQQVDTAEGDVKLGPGQAGTFTAIVRKNRSLSGELTVAVTWLGQRDEEIASLKKQLADAKDSARN